MLHPSGMGVNRLYTMSWWLGRHVSHTRHRRGTGLAAKALGGVEWSGVDCAECAECAECAVCGWLWIGGRSGVEWSGVEWSGVECVCVVSCRGVSCARSGEGHIGEGGGVEVG